MEQNNYLPFLPAGGTFSPLETWEGKPPLEVCQLPPVGPRARLSEPYPRTNTRVARERARGRVFTHRQRDDIEPVATGICAVHA